MESSIRTTGGLLSSFSYIFSSKLYFVYFEMPNLSMKHLYKPAKTFSLRIVIVFIALGCFILRCILLIWLRVFVAFSLKSLSIYQHPLAHYGNCLYLRHDRHLMDRLDTLPGLAHCHFNRSRDVLLEYYIPLLHYLPRRQDWLWEARTVLEVRFYTTIRQDNKSCKVQIVEPVSTTLVLCGDGSFTVVLWPGTILSSRDQGHFV